MRRQMHQASKTGLATAAMQSPHRTYPDTHGEEPLALCWRLCQPHNLPPPRLGASGCAAHRVTTLRRPVLQWRDRSVPWCGGVALDIGSTHTQQHAHTGALAFGTASSKIGQGNERTRTLLHAVVRLTTNQLADGRSAPGRRRQRAGTPPSRSLPMKGPQTLYFARG